MPRVADDAAFVPPEDLGGAPHVVVDGARLPGTVLSLSHWPDAGTPPALAADTSAAIVDRYLRARAARPRGGRGDEQPLRRGRALRHLDAARAPARGSA